MTIPAEEPQFGRPGVKRIAQGLVGVTLAVIMLWWALPHVANTSWSEVFRILGTIPKWKGLVYAGLVLFGLYFYTFVMTGSMPGLSHLRALILNICGSSVSNLLPGGGAAGLAATYTIARSWGFSREAVSTQAIVSGIWNVLARVLLPTIAMLILALGAHDLPGVLQEAAIGGAITAIIVVGIALAALANERAAARVGRFIDKVLRVLRPNRTGAPWAEQFVALRERVIGVVSKGWLQMTLGMVGFFGINYVLFVLCLQTMGISMFQGQMFAAFAIGRLLTAVPVTPGGLGFTETGVIAALVAWGAPSSDAMAAVVLFSLFTHLMEVPLGALGWLAWSLMPKASQQELAATDSEPA